MPTSLEKRLDALEQAAKLLAARNKPTTIGLDFEVMRQRLETLSREGPELTQAEMIQKCKDTIARMNARWELQRGGI